mgnify:CR=1 FL=1
MTRRIVQIATSHFVGVEGVYPSATLLYALTDDGRIYSALDDVTQWSKGEKVWQLVPDIPQDTPAEAPDPITELEAIGGAFYRDPVRDGVRWSVCFNQTWLYEVIGERCDTALLRAAAARLLARVRGGAK